jgi:hypothetical protein
MKTIHKQSIPCSDEFELSLPKYYKILKIGIQYDKPVIWYEFPDVGQPLQFVTAKFKTVPTGGYMKRQLNLWEYVDTYLTLDDHFVGHVYRRII